MSQSAPADAALPQENTIARVIGAQPYRTDNANVVPMAPQALSPTGGGLPHNNMQPYLTFNFCIALQGVFPPRG